MIEVKFRFPPRMRRLRIRKGDADTKRSHGCHNINHFLKSFRGGGRQPEIIGIGASFDIISDSSRAARRIGSTVKLNKEELSGQPCRTPRDGKRASERPASVTTEVEHSE